MEARQDSLKKGVRAGLSHSQAGFSREGFSLKQSHHATNPSAAKRSQ